MVIDGTRLKCGAGEAPYIHRPINRGIASICIQTV